MNWDKVNELIAQKYISKTKHPSLDLWILNYTHAAQYDDAWCEETELCRGLIVDEHNTVVARPFRKFRNLSQVHNLPAEDFEVTEKMDGSLGVMYFETIKNDGNWLYIPRIATRGSFTSDQAIKANEILRRKLDNFELLHYPVQFNPALTYLWEIIYPENRIVVDYGKTEDLVLLSIVVTATGDELPYSAVKLFADSYGFSMVPRYDGITDFSKIEARDNHEGYVVKFASGLRVKIKHDEYVRLHRLLTNVNAKAIWELLRAGQDIKELIERVPDEFYQWVQKTVQNLHNSYETIESYAKCTFRNLDKSNRKEFALAIQHCMYKSVLFAMLDGKDYTDIIWKMIRPEAEKPFRMEI